MSCNGSESLQATKQADLNHSHQHGFISPAEKVISIEDLLHEILLPLPTKSLLRFQCVSKRWFSVISSSHFRRLHTRKITSSSSSASPSGIFLVGDSKKVLIYLSKSANMLYRRNNTIHSNMETTFLDRALTGSFIFHSCNGLLCISLPFSKYNKSSSHVCCHVYNPITRLYTDIPRPDYKQSGYLSAMNLAFDPTKSDQFKIIYVWEDMIEFSFYIYSSKTDSWKDSGISFDARHYRYGFSDYSSSQYFFRNGVFLDGKIHWISNTKPFLCFDTESERFRSMPSTLVTSEKGRNIRYFAESGGHLHLIQESNPRATLLNVLELRRDYSEWYAKYQVDVEFVSKMYPQVVDDYGDFRCQILSLLLKKDDQKMKLLLSIPEKIISFDVDDGTINEVLDVEPELGHYKWHQAYKHFENLADI